MPEMFDCCSLYVECSDELHCLRDINNPEYSNCGYRIFNLDKGRIFYGKNANIQDEKFRSISIKNEPIINMPGNVSEAVIETPKNFDIQYEDILEETEFVTGYVAQFSEAVLERYRKHEVYLNCMGKQYTVKALIKDYSYGLSRDQAKRISNLFQALDIPFSTECVEPKKTELAEVCNSRVIISIGDEKFRIAAWNDYLIPSSESKKLAKAFEAKGIDSGIETYATRAFSTESNSKPMKAVTKDKIVKPEINETIPKVDLDSLLELKEGAQTYLDFLLEPEENSKPKEDKKPYEQTSMFDLIGV